MGARLRLKAVKDLSGYHPELQKIFRAMQRYGLIVADNGSDMYISGAFDPRWNNDILNPAFRSLTANDFDVLELGWRGGAASSVRHAGAPSPFATRKAARSWCWCGVRRAGADGLCDRSRLSAGLVESARARPRRNHVRSALSRRRAATSRAFARATPAGSGAASNEIVVTI